MNEKEFFDVLIKNVISITNKKNGNVLSGTFDVKL